MIISTVEFQICFRGVWGGDTLLGFFAPIVISGFWPWDLSNVPSSVFTRNTAGRKYSSASYSIMANLLVISHLKLFEGQ